jgi:hypothetical protein
MSGRLLLAALSRSPLTFGGSGTPPARFPARPAFPDELSTRLSWVRSGGSCERRGSGAKTSAETSGASNPTVDQDRVYSE